MKERLTIENAKTKYINKVYNYLTIIDVVQYYDKYNRKRGFTAICKCACGNICTPKLEKVLSGHTHSCGCYKKSEESKDKYSFWLENNKQAVKLMHEHRIKTITDNNIQSIVNKKNSIIAANKRSLIDMSNVIDLINQNDLILFMNGAIRINDKIRTRCPVCGNYAPHIFSKVFKVTDNICICRNIPVCNKCNKLVSHQEDEIENYISTFYSGKIIRNSREIISPYELDLYYPEKKIAIEFNGDYWHSNKYKSKDYHYKKYTTCCKYNIALVSIFESAWYNYKDNIKNYLYDLFNNKENKLSFNEDHSLMNNNYPSPYLITLSAADFLEDSYSYDKYKVYTCGYTILR